MIIREHGVREDGFALFLDVVHALYATVINDEETPEAFLQTYESFYHPKEVWSNEYLEPGGFAFAGLTYPHVGGGRGRGRGKPEYDLYRSYYARYRKEL